jgi:hypothetical protein
MRISTIVLAWSSAAALWAGAASLHLPQNETRKTTSFEDKLNTRVGQFDTSGRSLYASLFDLACAYKVPLTVEYADHIAATQPIDLHFRDEYLRNIFSVLAAQIPEYRVSFSNGLIDVYMPSARADSSNLLNIVIQDFAVTNADTQRANMELFCAVISQTHGGACAGSIAPHQWGDKKITLSMHTVRVYEILNAIVAQNGEAAWTVIVPPEKLARLQNGGNWHIYPLEPAYKTGILEKLAATLNNGT